MEATPDLEELRALAEPTIIGWAVSVSDMGAARRAMSTAAVILDTEEPGSRVLPSGTTLQWSTATLSSPEITMAPFLIRWNPSTQHPSTTSPSGCSLSGLEVHDPAAADLSRALNALRVSGVTIRRGEPEIAVSLSCPRGRVRLQRR